MNTIRSLNAAYSNDMISSVLYFSTFLRPCLGRKSELDSLDSVCYSISPDNTTEHESDRFVPREKKRAVIMFGSHHKTGTVYYIVLILLPFHEHV